MCQRRLCFSQLMKWIIHFVFCLLIFIHTPVFSQQDTLKITFEFCSISDTTVFSGLEAAFPDPVLSLITVRDQNNKYIHNLADTTDWLSRDETALCGILVDSIWHQIHEYHREDNAIPDDPDVKHKSPSYQVLEVFDIKSLSVALVMDYSKTMGDSIEVAEEAARLFVRRKKSNDEVAIIKFSHYDSVYQNFTTDTTELLAAIAAPFDDRWGTVIYDAMYTAVDLPLSHTGRRAVVAYTDGTNNGSVHTRQDVIDLAQEKEIPIFTIGVGAHVWHPGLIQIADSTGGEYFSSSGIQGIGALYLSIYGYIGGYYVMAHTTTDPATDGTWRTVDLTLDYLNDDDHWISGRGFGEYQAPYVPPDIALSKRIVSESYQIRNGDTLYYATGGDTVSYQIAVTNIGSGTAGNMNVVDMLADSLLYVDFEIPPYSSSSEMAEWRIPYIGVGESRRFTYRCYVNLSTLPWQDDVPFVNEAYVTCVNDEDLNNNSDEATLWIGAVPPPQPQIKVSPQVVEPGDSVRVDVQTLVPVKRWDLNILFEDNSSDTTYADSFIALTELIPNEWKRVIPDFGDTWMRTSKTKERMGVVLRIWGLWNGAMSDTAYFTVGSADEFWLDDNVFRANMMTHLGMRFKLSSNRHARITVYDIAGGFVDVALDRDCVGGWNYDQWDGKDKNGHRVGSGVYIAILVSGNFRQDRKLIVVR